MVALERKLRQCAIIFQITLLRPFSAAPIGCTQRVALPDMNSMERLDIFIGCDGIMLSQFCSLLFSTRLCLGGGGGVGQISGNHMLHLR